MSASPRVRGSRTHPLFMRWRRRDHPRARGADVTRSRVFSCPALHRRVVLYHVALGFICQRIGRGIQLLDSVRPPRTPIVDPHEPSH